MVKHIFVRIDENGIFARRRNMNDGGVELDDLKALLKSKLSRVQSQLLVSVND